jgi:choice-of-anchor B domain-containing protein
MRMGVHAAAFLALGSAFGTAPAAAQTWAGAGPGPRMAGFGRALAVGEGMVLVGEARNSLRPGILYQYGRSGSSWVEQAQIKAPDAENSDGFGASLALDGSTLLVSQVPRGLPGLVHVFTREGTGPWRHASQFAPADSIDRDGFGSTLALSGDWAVVGAPLTGERAGAAYVFQRSGATWTQRARLAPAELQQGDAFGSSLALNGSFLLVGAPGRNQRAGNVFVFALQAGTWTEAGQFAARGLQANESFGASLSLAGDMALVGAPSATGGTGAVVGFSQNEQGQWTEVGRLVAFDGARQDGFGVAIAASGNEIWVGSPRTGGTGVSYVFVREASGGMVRSSKVRANDAIRGDAFGGTLALRDNVAAVGMIGADGGAGTVVIFEKDASGAWRERATVESEAESLPAITGGEVRCSDEGKADIFDCGNVELLSFLPIKDIGGGRGTNLNDIWGWTDPETNKEYALVGRTDGTSFVDVTDPVNPKYLGDLPKTEGSPSASWRDIKVYNNHAYVVADASGAHGIQVFDLTRLRNVTSPQTFTMDAHYTRIHSAHNIVINEESGFAYSVGSSSGGETCGGGLHMVDIREPKNPKFAGCFADAQTGNASTGYSHDAQCVMYKGPDEQYRGREICLGSNETALSVADVTDKANPKAISRASYPNVAYTHQGWLTDDHRYFYMNDEGDEANGSVPRTRTLIWDLADLDDPQLVGEYLGETAAIDHNLYVKGDFVYESNYMAGMRILDITNREKPVEVGFIDTLPFGENVPSFAGSWSNYPYFESGTIIVSSIGEGLFVVKKRSPTTVF